MKYNFNQVIDRVGTASEKWDNPVMKTEEKENFVSMWIADMDFPSPVPVIDALRRRVEHGIYGYGIRTESYIQAIIDWLKRRHNWEILQEWITHSPGVVPAISLAIKAFTKSGDKIIVQPPVYHHFSRVIQANGCEVLNNPLILENNRYKMNLKDLEEKIKDPKVKMLILCSPHNPVGRIWNREELQQLGNLCTRHKVLVISDEIHFDIVFKPYLHIPFASVSKELANCSITCISPSKTFNVMGLNTSSLIIPNCEIRETFNHTLEKLSIGTPNIFGVVALEAAYRYGDDWLEQLLEYLKRNLEYTINFLKERVPKIKVIPPEGTYLLWLDCRELNLSITELNEFMLNKAGVAMNEGHIFGKEGLGFMRLNFGCPRTILKNALIQIEDAVNTLYKDKKLYTK